MTTELVPLTTDECLGLLTTQAFGRLAVIHDGWPIAMPVNYRVVDRQGRPAFVVRTRSHSVLDRPDMPVALEIDGIAPDGRSGWSVLVRGVLRVIEPGAEVDPHPAPDDERDAWRAVVAWSITGRRLVPEPGRWAFDLHGYL